MFGSCFKMLAVFLVSLFCCCFDLILSLAPPLGTAEGQAWSQSVRDSRRNETAEAWSATARGGSHTRHPESRWCCPGDLDLCLPWLTSETARQRPLWAGCRWWVFSGKKACGYSGEVRKSVGSVGWLVRWICPGSDGCRCLCAVFGVCERRKLHYRCFTFAICVLDFVCCSIALIFWFDKRKRWCMHNICLLLLLKHIIWRSKDRAHKKWKRMLILIGL